MEHRMKLTDIKTARTHRESFPFLRANIQRLVGGWERERRRESALLKTCGGKKLQTLNLPYQSAFFLLSFSFSHLISNSDIKNFAHDILLLKQHSAVKVYMIYYC